jgi:hypothetical protein
MNDERRPMKPRSPSAKELVAELVKVAREVEENEILESEGYPNDRGEDEAKVAELARLEKRVIRYLARGVSDRAKVKRFSETCTNVYAEASTARDLVCRDARKELARKDNALVAILDYVAAPLQKGPYAPRSKGGQGSKGPRYGRLKGAAAAGAGEREQGWDDRHSLISDE